MSVEARALYQGRTHQLWRVDITDESGRLVAHGEVRLQNIAATSAETDCSMSEALILGGVRTPFGRYGGALSHIRTDELFGRTMVGACERSACRWTRSRTSPAAV